MTGIEDHILIHALLDGEVEPAVAAALEPRIKADPLLAVEYDRAASLKKKLADLSKPAASQEFTNRIDRLTEQSLRSRWGFGDWRNLAASILVTALLSSGLTYSLIGHSMGFDEADAVAASHRRSLLAASPIDVASSDSHTVKPWLDAHVGVSPPAIDLATNGFALVGGRVDVIGDRAVPSLVYRHKEHLISVLALPLRAGESQIDAPKHLNAGGMQMIHLSENGFSYWVVSDMEWVTLDSFVADFRAKSGGASN